MSVIMMENEISTGNLKYWAIIFIVFLLPFYSISTAFFPKGSKVAIHVIFPEAGLPWSLHTKLWLYNVHTCICIVSPWLKNKFHSESFSISWNKFNTIDVSACKDVYVWKFTSWMLVRWRLIVFINASLFYTIKCT